MSKGQSGSESIARAQGGHVMLPYVPRGGDECGEQASRENSTCLQCVDAEDLSCVCGVIAPLIDDVQNLGADDAAEDDQNPQIPSLVAVVAEALGVAHADPQADQYTQGDKESIGRQKKAPDMKKLWEH